MRKLKETGLTQHELADKLGINRSKVAHAVRRTKGKPNKSGRAEVEESGLTQQLQQLLMRGATREGICERLNISDRILKVAIEELADSGYQIDETNGDLKLCRDVVPQDENLHEAPWKGNKIIRFGLCGDNQINSKWTQLTYAHQLYDIYQAEGIKVVYHTGDIDEGEQMRPGHQYECYNQGADEHVAEIVKNYPQRSGMKTYFITGNHDHSLIKRAGYDIGRPIADKRDDMVYLGQSYATVNLTPNCILELRHPLDGTAYAICFSDDTEIFTDSGWKLFKDLDKTEKYLTWNIEKNSTEWQAATDYIAEPYVGDMVHFNSKRLDFIVTPNHRMLVRRPWDGPWKFVQAGDISARQWCINKIIPGWVGSGETEIHLPIPIPEPRGTMQNYQEKINSKLFVAFLGWYLSEGNIGHKNKCVELSQSQDKNPDKYQEIVSLCKSMGFKPYCTATKIKITSRQMYDYFKQFGRSHDKYIPQEFKNMDTEHLAILLDALFMGDGTLLDGKLQNYSTNSKQLADDIQEIAMKCGMSCTIKKYIHRETNFKMTRPMYQISIAHKMTTPSIEVEPERVSYDGIVYCVSVPNETILVRRNGKVMWSGNSYKMQKMVDAMSGGEKPNILAVGHYHKVEYLFYRNIHIYQTGALQAQTPWMRGKQIAAMLGGWIIEAHVDDEGTIVRMKQEFIPFYYGIPDDYKNWQ